MAKKPPRTEQRLDDPAGWVDQYGDLLYRFALSRVREPSLAEDLVQETFLAALGARNSFQGDSAVRTWLIGILKHKIVDSIRKRVRESSSDKVEAISDAAAVESVDAGFTEKGAWRTRPARWSVNPMEIYRQKEFMDVLYRCLGELPQRLASAFMLREIDGLSTEEICKELDISATNSWVMLYRARMWLRQCLESQWIETEK